jgi:uncharacterized protein (TIGR02145 family)
MIGDTPDELPLTSNNGIPGTWEPSVIETSVAGTETYTFNPHPDECAFTAQITVTVKPPHFVITATAGVYGWITPDGANEIEPGEDQTFTFGAEAGYELYQVLVDGVNVPAAILAGSYTFETVDADHTIVIIVKSTLSACPEQVYDEANNIIYNVVELTGLCWTKENLRNTKYADGSAIQFAQPYEHMQYPDIVQNETDFGLLYDWYAAAKASRSVQGICPAGWRLPTLEEWQMLIPYHADELRSTAFWLSPNAYNNATHFGARGAGIYNSGSERFENLYGYTAYWSSNAGATTATAAVLNYYCTQIEMVELKLTNGISVRCVME